MKKIIIFCGLIFCAAAAVAQTINWYVDGSVYQTTTCNSGDSITPPTPPAKYGYTFQRWIKGIPIEYLESTGTQYIDTGFKPNQDTRVILKYFITENNISTNLFGGRSNYMQQAFMVNYDTSESGSFRFHYGNSAYGKSLNSNFYQNVLFLDVNKNVVSLRDSENFYIADIVATYSNFQSNTNMCIFNTCSAGVPGRVGSQMRIYYFQIYNNNTLVRDFIPVLDSNGVACMFDKVSQQFFYNAGTGDFTAGPKIGE